MMASADRLSATESPDPTSVVELGTNPPRMVVWMANEAGTSAHAIDGSATIVDGWALPLCHPGRRVHVGAGSTEGVARCSNCVHVAARGCGSYAGYQHHKRRGQMPCQPCRDANARYQRDRRNEHRYARERDYAANAARQRALWRLADAYPDHFRALVADEMREINR